MFKIQQVAQEEVPESMRKAYFQGLLTPLDGMWENTVVNRSKHWLVAVSSGEVVGFFSVYKQSTLVCFFLQSAFVSSAQHLLSQILSRKVAYLAAVGTNDPFLYSLCQQLSSGQKLTDYLFKDAHEVAEKEPSLPSMFFRVARKQELKKVRRFYRENVGFTDPDHYIDRLIGRKEIFILYHKTTFLNSSFLAVGECRVSATQAPYADLGMMVAKKYRNKGLATYLLILMKKWCYKHHLIPICSCEATNLASKKAIEKAGFAVCGQITEFSFPEITAPQTLHQ